MNPVDERDEPMPEPPEPMVAETVEKTGGGGETKDGGKDDK